MGTGHVPPHLPMRAVPTRKAGSDYDGPVYPECPFWASRRGPPKRYRKETAYTRVEKYGGHRQLLAGHPKLLTRAWRRSSTRPLENLTP